MDERKEVASTPVINDPAFLSAEEIKNLIDGQRGAANEVAEQVNQMLIKFNEGLPKGMRACFNCLNPSKVEVWFTVNQVR